MTLRKIWVVIRNLRPDSALGRKANPEQWRRDNYQLADLYDLLLAVNTDGKKERKWYPRPGDIERAEVKDAEKLRKIRESRDRFRQQLAAGGDV